MKTFTVRYYVNGSGYPAASSDLRLPDDGADMINWLVAPLKSESYLQDFEECLGRTQFDFWPDATRVMGITADSVRLIDMFHEEYDEADLPDDWDYPETGYIDVPRAVIRQLVLDWKQFLKSRKETTKTYKY